LTHLDPTGGSPLKSILVVGGSSAVGAGAIQLLRMALPSATILTTSSPQHHERLLALGATKCFDRSAQEDTSVIRAATPDGAGVDAILDAVAASAAQPSIFSALNPAGFKLVSHPITGQNPQAPDGVQIKAVMGRQVFGSKGGHAAMSALTGLVESGKYKLPTKIEVVGKGLDAISSGLDRLMKGVSGTKLVVSL
jgi:NADPH:quinone reductase-like Zn-dependent oxidoreductase